MSSSRRLLSLAFVGVMLLAGQATRSALPRVRPHSAWTSGGLLASDPTIARLRADQPGAALLHPIATDIDRDGDMDVVASSTQSAVDVWINDGHGHFERQVRTHARSLGADDRVATSLPGDSTAAATVVPRWHGPVASDRAFGAPFASLAFGPAGAPDPTRRNANDTRATRGPPPLTPVV